MRELRLMWLVIYVLVVLLRIIVAKDVRQEVHGLSLSGIIA